MPRTISGMPCKPMAFWWVVASFGTWNDRSKDSSLIIGRNFDFYVGDKFAEDKIVAFYKPDKGYRFMFITWAGFTGVVSA